MEARKPHRMPDWRGPDRLNLLDRSAEQKPAAETKERPKGRVVELGGSCHVKTTARQGLPK